MASKNPKPPSSGTDRRAKIQAATPRGAKGPSRILIGGIVVVVAIAVVVAWVIIADRSSKDRASAGGSALPKGASAMGAGLDAYPGVTPAKGAPTLDIYEDFQCPICKRFEQLFGSTVKDLGSSGKAEVRYHVLTFLDDNLGNDSSLRAANAAMCAADRGKFPGYHDAVYAGQPTNEGDGYTDDQLTQFATQAGITGSGLDAWQSCYDDRAHNQYVQSVQTQASKDGVNGTPTVVLNGSKLDLANLTPEKFRQNVLAAAK